VSGRLCGVGLGPGDPELLTLKAARLIAAADVIAYHSAPHGRSIARGVASAHLQDGQLEEPLVYPVTTGSTDHPGGYAGAMNDFYDASARRLASHLDAGRDVVVLCEGDPLFYGSYMYLHERLAGRYRAEVVPGVTSVSAAAAVLGRPLVERDEVLTVLPGTLPAPELARRLADTDAAAVLKLGRTFPAVREALHEAGRLGEAWYVERATTGAQRTQPLADVDAGSVPYFSLALVPSPASVAGWPAPTSAPAPAPMPAPAAQPAAGGEVVVVGLGPAGPQWLTPEAVAELAAAEHLVGYGPYLDRVPVRAGQQRHSSGNRVEAERAAEALELARGGARVAVVSSGDPGVFAMAAAVLQVADEPAWRGVPVRVLPGLTAAQAAASRVGAPLGHDFAVISLSDQLKPWDVVARRLAAAASADLVLALYNPASRSRTWQLAAARDVLLEFRKPSTPVVLARDVGGPEEDVQVLELGTLDPAAVDMRCLLIIGSSATRVTTRADGSTGVYTPRHYSP
jgi:precorrin-2 C20-methyltransferase/precorrin-3B C17-methyltransferase